MSPLSNGEKPEQRNAANARERARMRVLSRAFCRLKTTLPWVPADTKLSKLDTLRLATSYIAHLRTMLGQEDNSRVQPLSLASTLINLKQKLMFHYSVFSLWHSLVSKRVR